MSHETLPETHEHLHRDRAEGTPGEVAHKPRFWRDAAGKVFEEALPGKRRLIAPPTRSFYRTEPITPEEYASDKEAFREKFGRWPALEVHPNVEKFRETVISLGAPLVDVADDEFIPLSRRVEFARDGVDNCEECWAADCDCPSDEPPTAIVDVEFCALPELCELDGGSKYFSGCLHAPIEPDDEAMRRVVLTFLTFRYPTSAPPTRKALDPSLDEVRKVFDLDEDLNYVGPDESYVPNVLFYMRVTEEEFYLWRELQDARFNDIVTTEREGEPHEWAWCFPWGESSKPFWVRVGAPDTKFKFLGTRRPNDVIEAHPEVFDIFNISPLLLIETYDNLSQGGLSDKFIAESLGLEEGKMLEQIKRLRRTIH